VGKLDIKDAGLRALRVDALKAASDPRYASDVMVLWGRYALANAMRDQAEVYAVFELLAEQQPSSYDLFRRHEQTISDFEDFDGLRRFAERLRGIDGAEPRMATIAAVAEWDMLIMQQLPKLDMQSEEIRAVWDRISGDYDHYLEKAPNDRVAHAHYAFFAFHFSQFETAVKHFDAAGDDGDDPTTPSMDFYDYARRKAAEKIEK
jgi:hypothetical protein